MTAQRATIAGRIRAVTLATVVTVMVVFACAGPASAEPSPAEIEKQIDEAWNRLEPIIEQYNAVHSELAADQAKAEQLRRQLEPLQRQVDAAMDVVNNMAATAYKGQRMSALRAVVDGSPATLIDQMVSMNQVARRQRRQIADVAALRDRFAQEKRAVDSVVAGLVTRDAELAAQKKDIEDKIAELQTLRQRAGAQTSNAGLRTGPCPVDYVPGPGGTATQKACSLIGKPYIWGSAGPGGYDCSGLTLAAWSAAGVTLRHYTKWQWEDGRPVSRADLRPGDLVFYYSDLHHMGIYVGGNTIVHAPTTGDYVRMAPLDRGMPIAGFRRVK